MPYNMIVKHVFVMPTNIFTLSNGSRIKIMSVNDTMSFFDGKYICVKQRVVHQISVSEKSEIYTYYFELAT